MKATVLRTVMPQLGWWGRELNASATPGENDTALFLECPLPDSCLGGFANGTAVCNTDAGFANGSILCGTCSERRVRYRDECVECPPLEQGLLMSLLLFVIMLCVVHFLTREAAHQEQHSEVFETREVVKKILVTYLVTLSRCATAAVCCAAAAVLLVCCCVMCCCCCAAV